MLHCFKECPLNLRETVSPKSVGIVQDYNYSVWSFATLSLYLLLKRFNQNTRLDMAHRVAFIANFKYP